MMKMSESFPQPNIEQEAALRAEVKAILDVLPGYQALSPRQQQMIRLSLKMQQRAERRSDEASAR